MAIKQIVSDGIGFDAGVIGWLLTQGIGNFSAPGGGLDLWLLSPFGLRIRRPVPWRT